MENQMRAIHPGEVLREEFLAPLGISNHALALALRVPATRIHDIVHEKRNITPDSALRLAIYFGTTAEFWLNLQNAYDLKTAMPKVEADHILPYKAKQEISFA